MSSDLNITQKGTEAINKGLETIANDTIISIYNAFPFLGYSIYGVTYAQIILAIFTFIFILVVRPLLVKSIIKVFSSLANRTKTRVDDLLVQELESPLRFALFVFGLYMLVFILNINFNFVNNILSSFALYTFFLVIVSLVNALEDTIHKLISTADNDLSREFTKFVIRAVKLVVIVVGAASILSLWGINVTALIASLGIGGLAFALAAKDTAANLFGSIAILLDKSIKLGDWVLVNSAEGIVEDIGMRTTKIRTFQKSIIVIPNNIVANSPIENFSRRSNRRIEFKIGILYSTPKSSVKLIVAEIRNLISNHEGIDNTQTILVNFDTFGDSALEILIYCFTDTANWQKYLDIKEDINYKIIDIVKNNKSDFAFPSESIYIESMPN